ncbi:hypothetical protein [Lysobacter sp. Hz 25]
MLHKLLDDTVAVSNAMRHRFREASGMTADEGSSGASLNAGSQSR